MYNNKNYTYFIWYFLVRYNLIQKVFCQILCCRVLFCKIALVDGIIITFFTIKSGWYFYHVIDSIHFYPRFETFLIHCISELSVFLRKNKNMLSTFFTKNQNKSIIIKIVFFETPQRFPKLDIYKCLFFISQFTFQLFLKSRLMYTFKPKIMIP